MEKKYLVISAVVVAALGAYCVMFLSILIAMQLLALGLLGILYIYLHLAAPIPYLTKMGWSAITSGAIIAVIVTMMKNEYLLCAVVIIPMFLLLLSYSRNTGRYTIFNET